MRPLAILCILTASILLPYSTSHAERVTIDLSRNQWGIARNFEVGWFDDDIALPPVDIASLPVNPP